MEFFVILTLVLPNGSVVTKSGLVQTEIGSDRHDVFETAIKQSATSVGDQVYRANVMFYSAEPNTSWSQAR